jgi:hypothetical protein
MTAGSCRQVFFDVTLNRSPSSRLKSRGYQITVTGDGGLSASGPQRQLYIEKLVSQNRNHTKELAGSGGCNLAYTVCAPAPTNVIVGRTYTYKFYAETSTAYQQLESFVNFPSSFLQVLSTSTTYSNPSGATSGSIYGDACGWSPTTRSCVGPANITGGKAGGRLVVTYVIKVGAPGSGSLASTIYDFSGSSYHYNADHDSAALLASPLTASYGVDATIVGNGKVTSVQNGTLSDGSSSALDCGGTATTCAVGYPTGTTASLTALPLGLETFAGWSGGGCSGISPTCTVTMDQSRSVTATFTGVTSYPLDVAKVGSGTVTADSGSLNCGATCTSRYANGTLVTLNASPSAGWIFSGWSGEGCSGTTSCQVTMSQARSVTATFTEQTYPLTVSSSGNGTVSANLGTINCGNGNTFCSDTYGAGTVVTLTATPGSGQTFTGWSGADCSGTSATCTVTMSQARSATASFSGTAIYPLNVGTDGDGTGTVTSNVGGINCGSTCSASYSDGTIVTLTASPGSGSNFVGWNGDCSGTSTTCAVTLSQARDVVATFGVPQGLTVTKAGAGTVTSDVGGINCGAACSASIAEGTVVTLTASPSAGSAFTGWSGDCAGTGTCTVTMSAARNVTAAFALAYTLSIAKAGSGSGTVSSDVGGISCGATCSASYVDGTVVTLTATPGSASRFTGWSGAGCSGTGACTVTMSAARSVTASFVAVYTLTVGKSGSGSGSVSSDVGGISCGATCSADYDDATVVTLTASAGSGSRFAGWSGAGCSGTGACTVTMSAARSVTATFIAVYTLTVGNSGSGSGSVSSDLGGISCGSACSADYDDATVVTLTASAGSGSRFAGWSGGGCSGTGSCVVTMSAARSVGADFVPVYTLTVGKSGSGSGSVSSDLGGISCGSTCGAGYDDGTVVTLTASAGSGSRFAGWSGGGCSGTGSCVVTMSGGRNVTANFVALYALTVIKGGSGSVSSDVAGIDCGSTCSADYDDGTVVTLTASAGSGSRFSGWSGAGCSGTGSCVVTMSAARSATATFVAVYALGVTKDGSGSGSVSSDVGGISCGSTCNAVYDDGTGVTLTASAGSGSRFAGWSGAGCSGTGACTVTMSAGHSVTASFVALYTLTLGKSGSGFGSVASSPAGVSCGATCSADYDDGTVVTLTAIAAAGSRFTGWSGAGCSGTGSCVVTMGTARSVTAGFVLLYTLSVTKTGSGSGSVSAIGIDCGSTCNAEYDDGTAVTLMASAANGSTFAGWSGAGCSGIGTCVVTMSAARSVTATFEIPPTLTPTPPTLTPPTLSPPPPAPTARFTLVVTRSGSGRGTVTSELGAVRCGADCSSSYDGGTVVALTGTAATGSRFAGWSGAGCSGTQSCVVTMSAEQHVHASFVQVFALHVDIDGRGSVSSTDPGLDCRSACGRRYDAGGTATLVAHPAHGYWFTGWSGACHGKAPTCSVTISRAKDVRAHFARELGLRLQVTAGLVYHFPYEHAVVRALVSWRGRPVAGVRVRVTIVCPGRRVSAEVRSRRDGRATLTYGTDMPDSVRIYNCPVVASVVANGLSARSGKSVLHFIHPLWLETKRGKGGKIVVRVWGRRGNLFELHAGARVVATGRIGRVGWIDLSPAALQHGERLWVRGHDGLASHVIIA